MVSYMKDCSKSLYRNDTPELTKIVDSNNGKDAHVDSEITGFYLEGANPKYIHSNSFKDTIENKLKDMKTAIIENKAANLASAGGLLLALGTNYISGTYAGQHDFSYSAIDWTSFIFEVIPHALTSGVILYKTYRKQGLSKKDTLKNMAIIGALTTTLTLGAYKPLRDVISNHFMDIGNPAGLATLKAQLSLMTEYIIISSTASYFTLKAFGRLPKDILAREQKKAEVIAKWKAAMTKVDESRDEIRKSVDDVVENYLKQNPRIRKNGHSVIDPTAV